MPKGSAGGSGGEPPGELPIENETRLLEFLAPTSKLFDQFQEDFAPTLKLFDQIQEDFAPTLKLFDQIQEDFAPTLKLFDQIQEDFAPALKLFDQIQEDFAPISQSFANIADLVPTFGLPDQLQEGFTLPNGILQFLTQGGEDFSPPPESLYRDTVLNLQPLLRQPSEAPSKPEKKPPPPIIRVRRRTGVFQGRCLALVKRVAPQFAHMYTGGFEALNGDNPDRVRHASASLRELGNRLLKPFAPDDDVIVWLRRTGRLQEGLQRNGRPAHWAKAMYAFRDHEASPLAKVWEPNSQVQASLIQLLNSGVHQPRFDLTDGQLASFFAQIDSWLEQLLLLHLNSRR